MTLYSDFIDVTIGGVNVSDYVITYQRDESLCEPGQLFTLTMTRKKPDDSLLDIEVSDSVVIEERYGGSFTNVLKGYVTKVEINAEKALMTVRGSDKYILLTDYFIPQRLETSGQTVAYWIEYICNLAGLNVQFDVTPNAITEGTGDGEGTPLGMQSALEAIRTLERKGTCYTRYDSSADKIIVYRLETSQPKVNVNSSNLLSIDHSTATKGTRNVVKVWGGYRYDWLTGTEIKYNATARAEIPELVVDQTTVIASPEIKSFTFANIVAQRILASTADLDDIAICECAGLYPSVKIGDWIYISITQGELDYTRERQITSINISVDTNGAKTSFVVGEKCPRVSVSPPLVPIYVTDTVNGVGVSWDAGDSFSPSNIGLSTSDDLNGKSIAVNNYGRQMVVTAGGLHKRLSGLSTWVEVTNLPDPTNESNDPNPLGITNLEMMKVVDEPLKPFTFHMIASGGHPSGWYRSYVFTTEDYGYNWKTTQMWVPAISGGLADPYYQEHPMAPSGRVYDVWTHDMAASLGNAVTVLVSSPYIPLEEETPLEVYVLEATGNSTGNFSLWDGTTKDIQSTFTCSGFVISAKIWSVPTNREICYAGIIANDGPTSSYRGAITYVYKTTDSGTTWTKVHDALFIADSADCMISSYTVNFDPSSTSGEVRIGFCGFKQVSGNNDCTAYARFVSSVPGGGTTYNDVNSGTINLTQPSLGGGESFGGYLHNSTAASYNFNTGFKNATYTGKTWASAGFYGAINNPSRTDTSRVGLIVELDFSSETVYEFNQKQWRTGDTNNIPAQCHVYSAESGLVYATLNKIPSTAYVTTGTWTDLSGTSGNGYNDFERNTGNTKVLMKYNSGVPDYDVRDTSGTDTATTFYPDVIGNLNRTHACQINKQFSGATNYWCFSDSSFLGDPDGFCYSSDGVNWTSEWSTVISSQGVWDFSWRTFT